MVAHSLIAVVALLHVYFLILEMLLWTKPAGLRAFRLTPEFAAASKTLAANQGLYNGFLAAGLLWSTFVQRNSETMLFFLVCVVVAGIYGALTVSKKIFYIQALPALFAIAALYYL